MIPFFIPPPIDNIEKVYNRINKYFNQNIPIKHYKTKAELQYYYLIYAYDYFQAKYFITNDLGLDFSAYEECLNDYFDNNAIKIAYNTNYNAVVSAFEEISSVDTVSDIAEADLARLNDSFMEDELNDPENVISRFFAKCIREENPPNSRYSGVLINSFAQKILFSYNSKCPNKGVTLENIYVNLIKACDSGGASTKMYCYTDDDETNAVGCFVQNGEQAARFYGFEDIPVINYSIVYLYMRLKEQWNYVDKKGISDLFYRVLKNIKSGFGSSKTDKISNIDILDLLNSDNYIDSFYYKNMCVFYTSKNLINKFFYGFVYYYVEFLKKQKDELTNVISVECFTADLKHKKKTNRTWMQ